MIHILRATSCIRGIKVVRSTHRCLNISASPYALVDVLEKEGLRRGYIVKHGDGEDLKVSSESLRPIAEYLISEKCMDYDDHEGLYFEIGRETRALLGAFIHKTTRGPAGGGIRLKEYETLESYLFDGLRLATGMSRKSALTGLWHGGGKGVIAQPENLTEQQVLDRAFRNRLFSDYGHFITSLRGCYNAAEDSGVTVEDMDIVYSHSRFTTCISPSLGGSGNPSVPTALGVTMAMEAAFDYLNKTPKGASQQPLKGKTVAIQGCGNVGRPLIQFLLEKGVSSIIAAEPNPHVFHIATNEFAANNKVHIRQCEYGDNSILLEKVDIVSCNAWGGVLDKDICSRLQGKVVCGAANSQMLRGNEAGIMRNRGILYVPDFVANPMGIVNCANEMYGRIGRLGTTEDPMISDRLGKDYEFSVYNSTWKVLETSDELNICTATAANQVADKYMKQPHPIWYVLSIEEIHFDIFRGLRSLEIQRSIVAQNWAY